MDPAYALARGQRVKGSNYCKTIRVSGQEIRVQQTLILTIKVRVHSLTCMVSNLVTQIATIARLNVV